MTKLHSPLEKREAMKINVSDKISTLVTATGTAIATASVFVMTAYASTLGSKMAGFFATTYDDIKSVFDVAAIVALAFCLLTLLFGRTDKTADKSYSWLWKIVIAFVLFHSLGWLIPWVATQTGGSTISGVDKNGKFTVEEASESTAKAKAFIHLLQNNFIK